MGEMKTPEALALRYQYLVLQSGKEAYLDQAFLAGYQAAKDQLADAGKVMNSPEKPDGWISVKERLPEDGEQVFVIYSGKHCKDVHLSYYENGWSSLVDVTHWMPLPEAPKEEK